MKSNSLFIAVLLFSILPFQKSFSQNPEMLKDINPAGSSNPANMFKISTGHYLFAANDGTNGNELWITDGTTDGTHLLKDINPGNKSSDPAQFAQVSSNKIVFVADNGIDGRELWFTDGTSEGTILLKDIYKGKKYTTLSFGAVVNGKLFISAAVFPGDNTSKSGLYTTDGTVSGTQQLASDLVPSGYHGFKYAVLDNVFYFYTVRNAHFELWRSDGNIAGTSLIKTFGPTGNPITEMTVFNEQIFFEADDGVHGIELWKSDGSIAGTSIAKDIYPGTAWSDPDDFTIFDNHLFFVATDGTNGRELYETDGTEPGTHLFKDINPGTGSSDPALVLVSSTGALYFNADDGTHGRELWKSDGTVSGTILLQDVWPGSSSGSAGNLAEMNGEIYFVVETHETPTGKGTWELWKTDGTSAGTVLFDNSNTKPYVDPTYSNLQVINDNLYFIEVRPFDGGAHKQLWRTNGTQCGTQHIIFSPGSDEETTILLSDGDDLFVSAFSDNFGQEPWILSTIPIPAVEICNGVDDDCNGIVDDNALTASITPSGTFNACDGALVTLNASPTGNDLSYAWYWNGNLINDATTSSLSSSTLGGSVQVVVSSSFGCTGTSNVTVVNRVLSPPATITPQGDLDICATVSVILKANNGSGYSYQWQMNNVEIPGATKKQYTATSAGNYKVKVTNANGCNKISNKAAVFTSCKLPGNTPALDQPVVAYPNPFSGTTQIDLSKINWSNEGPLKIRIIDLSGKILFQKTFSNQTQIEIGNELPTGFYMVEVKGKNFSEVIPVIKQ